MSRKEKLIKRFLSAPADFDWNEVTTLMTGFGFEIKQGSGSRVKFYEKANNVIIDLHKPHPGNILKQYAVRKLKSKLQEYGYL